MKSYIDGKTIHVFADIAVYSLDVINKCLYWYGDKFRTSWNRHDEQFHEILLMPISPAIKKEELELYLYKIERDLVDFRLREVVKKETQTIKELLLAKAFSRFDTDESTSEDYRDPVQKKAEGKKAE